MVALLFLTACTTSATTPTAALSSPSASGSHYPSASPTVPSPAAAPAGSLAILLLPGPEPSNSTISIVDYTGRVIASAPIDFDLNRPSWQGRPGSLKPNPLMSSTSASLSRMYYLNGGSEVRFIALDGSRGTATNIRLGAYDQAGFAVSPDDSRIAVAIFSYAPPPASSPGAPPTFAGMRLYVEDLQGGGHHFDIFSSPTVAEFPIGWKAGLLVLAVGSPICCQAMPLNPYASTEYHVVDPATGTRLVALCAKSLGPEGPIEPSGVLCLESGRAPEFRRWDGSAFSGPGAIPLPQNLNALSPDGTRVAIGGDPIHVYGPGGRDDSFSGASGWVYGWIDDQHVVFQPQGANGLIALDVNKGGPFPFRQPVLFSARCPRPSARAGSPSLAPCLGRASVRRRRPG